MSDEWDDIPIEFEVLVGHVRDWLSPTLEDGNLHTPEGQFFPPSVYVFTPIASNFPHGTFAIGNVEIYKRGASLSAVKYARGESRVIERFSRDEVEEAGYNYDYLALSRLTESGNAEDWKIRLELWDRFAEILDANIGRLLAVSQQDADKTPARKARRGMGVKTRGALKRMLQDRRDAIANGRDVRWFSAACGFADVDEETAAKYIPVELHENWRVRGFPTPPDTDVDIWG